MFDDFYKVFRLLAILCLAAAIGLTIAFAAHAISSEVFGVFSGIIAVLISILGVYANKPVGKDDVSVAVDKVLTTYDIDTIAKLKQAQLEEQQIKEFIENRSNEIFLLKLREYLRQEIETKYRESEIAKLVQELEKVENKLDAMNVQYGSLELPTRFKKLLTELNQKEQVELVIDLIDALPIPFFPFKRLTKVLLRARYQYAFLKDRSLETHSNSQKTV